MSEKIVWDLYAVEEVDKTIIFRKNEIMNTWEQDWDDELLFCEIDENGLITKVHLETGYVFRYKLDEVV